MINKYLETYKRGSHCTSASIMNMCSYYGVNLSEDVCFGLGGGLGFSFYKIEQMSKYCFSGRSRDLERLFFETLGVKAQHKYCMKNNTVWEDLKYIVKEKKRPVLVKLDISTLDYLKEYFKLSEKMELSEHFAVIIGVNQDSVVISEYFKKEPIVLSKEQLFYSMNQRFEEKSLYNQYYDIHFTFDQKNLVQALKHSIYINSHQMLYGFGANLGLPGLKKFVNDIRMWSQYMSFEDARKNYLFAYISFEKIGTGGGNFRRIYSRFLRESANILNIEGLHGIMNLYAELAILWKKVSLEINKYAQLDDFSPTQETKIYDLLVTILELETIAISQLNKCIIEELNKYKGRIKNGKISN